MGVELFGILLIMGIVAAALFFFTGSFGIAKKAEGSGDSGGRPTHVYAESDTKGKTFGLDTTHATRARAEDDPETEIRA